MAETEKRLPERGRSSEIKQSEAVEQSPSVEVPESQPESASEQKGQGRSGEKEQAQAAQAQVAAASSASMPEAKDPVTQRIEGILSEDLGELYQSMTPDQQAAFKEKGEEIAGVVRQMVAHGRIAVRKVVHMIRKWLQMIPGVNKFFLEQEAKIKTDKLVHMNEEEQRR